MNDEITIRPFLPTDRASVYQIAADTAFFGEPVEEFLDDRKLFCDAFIGPYLDHPATICLVAEKQNKIFGYVLGCMETHERVGWLWKHHYPGLIGKILTCKYRFGIKTIQYSFRVAAQLFLNELPRTDSRRYPIDLHINLDETMRGFGVGKLLLEAYHDRLRHAGGRGVYLHTTDQNLAACSLYEKMGYRLFSSRKTGLWKRYLGKIVENRTYVISLI
jgi:GNAT superfamily N-acetyltransferase